MFDTSPPIGILLSHGIAQEVVTKFREYDIMTCLPLISLTIKDISAITGVSDKAELKKISDVALRLVVASGALGPCLGEPIPDNQGTGGEVLNNEETFAVLVKYLPGETTMEQVRDHFKAAGYPKRIGVIDGFKKKNRSAYLHYGSKSAADMALTFDKSRIGDQEITVEQLWGARSDESSSSGQSGQDKPYPKQEHFVFVNKIPKTATEEDLKKVFSFVPGLKHAVIVPKRDRPSFGFVYFKTREGAASALAMDNWPLKDAIISVKPGDPSKRKIFWDGDASGSGGPIRGDKGRHPQRPY